MEAIEIIEYLREQNFTVKADGEYLELAPAAKVTNELIERLRRHKTAIIAELGREERRLKVLALLEGNSTIQRAFLTDTESDPDSVILTMVIRDQYSFEMLIPKGKYDGFMMLELIQKGSVQ